MIRHVSSTGALWLGLGRVAGEQSPVGRAGSRKR